MSIKLLHNDITFIPETSIIGQICSTLVPNIPLLPLCTKQCIITGLSMSSNQSFCCPSKMNGKPARTLFPVLHVLHTSNILYRNLPIKGAPPHNKDAPLSLEEDNSARNHQNDHSFFDFCPIFNPKPALES